MEKEEIERILEECFLKYEQSKPDSKFILWVNEDGMKEFDKAFKEEVRRYLIKDLNK